MSGGEQAAMGQSGLMTGYPGQVVLSVNAFHEKGRSESSRFFCFSLDKVSSRRVAPDAMLPSALSEERLVRSVAVGRSRFQPVLPF